MNSTTNTYVDIHVLQAYPFSNLNRDRHNAPKSLKLGGVPRLRVSSQSLKRTVRIGQNESIRTSQFPQYLAQHLLGLNSGWTPHGAHLAGLLAALRYTPAFEKAEYRQQDRTFIGHATRDSLADYLTTNQAPIESQASTKTDTIEKAFAIGAYLDVARDKDWNSDLNKLVTGLKFLNYTDKGSDEKAKTDKAFQAEIAAIIGARGRYADREVALYGRFVAESKNTVGTVKMDSALRVAHAFTTHRAVAEEDFWVLADDLMQDSNDPGASNLGDDLFGAGVFYRYATIDVGQLVENLEGDETLAETVISDFLALFDAATPSGKQTQTAALTTPSLTHVQVRSDMPMSGSNAFEKAVDAPEDGTGYIVNSAKALDEFFGQAQGRSSKNHVEYAGYVPLGIDAPVNLGQRRVIEDLVVEAASAALRAHAVTK